MRESDVKQLMREAFDYNTLTARTEPRADLDEEAVTDDLGEIVAHDMVLDAAVAFGDAVQDVLQDHAKELVSIFVQRSDGDMLARYEDVDSMADDVVREALGNEDFRATLVDLAKSGLRKMVG